MNNMESGELELRKAFEQVTTNNLKMIQDYTTETRKIMRKTEEEVQELKNMIAMRDKQLTEMRTQLSVLQAKIYQGGS